MDYHIAKSLSICPDCGHKSTKPHVYCDACLELRSPGRTLNYKLRLLRPSIQKEHGPVIACCGSWHSIHTLPIVTACGHTYLIKK